jgi:hypothetical protein
VVGRRVGALPQPGLGRPGVEPPEPAVELRVEAADPVAVDGVGELVDEDVLVAVAVGAMTMTRTRFLTIASRMSGRSASICRMR